MERIRSWFGKSNSFASSENENNNTLNQINADRPNIYKESKSAPEVEKLDLKVVEFFKDFPEPYKTKAIDRFSSRDGFYQWDFFRDLAMKREFESAKRGVFLEDKRDFTRRLIEQEKKEEKLMQETEDVKEQSALEKAIRSKIPVQKDETLGLKFFQTGNFIALGLGILWTGVSSKKRKPTLSNFHYYVTVFGASYCCLYCQVAAVYRLMDWGAFDRSVDNRDALTKTVDYATQYFSSKASQVLKGKDES